MKELDYLRIKQAYEYAHDREDCLPWLLSLFGELVHEFMEEYEASGDGILQQNEG